MYVTVQVRDTVQVRQAVLHSCTAVCEGFVS
jgi:hypothetical protein